jgi:hypothetical protein
MKTLLILFITLLFCSGLMAQAPPPAPSLTLQWTNSTSEGVTGYNLYRSETAGSGYAQVNTELIPGDLSGQTEWTDTTVQYNSRYYYVCRAVAEWSDPAGDSGILESVNSNEVTEYIMPPAPNAPTGLIKKSLQP